jgi:hypothetical protein
VPYSLLVALLVLIAAACGSAASGSEGESAGPQAETGRTTTSAARPGVPIEPLTGVEVADAATLEHEHPALVVKIDNDPQARPQTGLNQADIVYEVRVEGITRFAAVFHSQASDPVGPIRSARSSDIDLMTNLNGPLFAWSGANPTVTDEVLGVQAYGTLLDVSQTAVPDDYWRDNSRRAPYNLYSSTPRLMAHAHADAQRPHPVLGYRAAGDPLPPSAVPASGVSVDFQSTRIPQVEFAWDPEVGGWRRFQTDSHHALASSAHVDAAGVQISPQNVVVLSVGYVNSAAGAYPQAVTVGSGEAHILTEGHVVVGRWVRPAQGDPIRLEDGQGNDRLDEPVGTGAGGRAAGQPALRPNRLGEGPGAVVD